jgi:hypothetical protein
MLSRNRIATVVAVTYLPAGVAMRAAPRQQAPSSPLPDVLKLGPQAGSKTPDFTRPDQHGQSRSLAPPGVAGYKPIALSIQLQAGLLVRDPQYPPAEDYQFKPLDEHVGVFQRPFRIVQDAAVRSSPQSQAALTDVTALTIRGVLNNQACDERVCFTLKSAPLTGTLSPRSLDRERARR